MHAYSHEPQCQSCFPQHPLYKVPLITPTAPIHKIHAAKQRKESNTVYDVCLFEPNFHQIQINCTCIVRGNIQLSKSSKTTCDNAPLQASLALKMLLKVLTWNFLLILPKDYEGETKLALFQCVTTRLQSSFSSQAVRLVNLSSALCHETKFEFYNLSNPDKSESDPVTGIKSSYHNSGEMANLIADCLICLCHKEASILTQMVLE